MQIDAHSARFLRVVLSSACVSAAFVAVIASGPVAAASGFSWTTQVKEYPAAAYSEASCGSALSCVVDTSLRLSPSGAPQTQLLVTQDGGGSFSVGTLAGGVSQVQSVDCVDASVCFATGAGDSSSSGVGAILKTSDGGRTWSSLALPTPPNEFPSDVAPGVTFGTSDFTAISCTTDAYCVAIGTAHETNDPSDPTLGEMIASVTTDGGATWSDPVLPESVLSESPAGVSCTSTSFCMATAYGGTGSLMDILTASSTASSWSASYLAPLGLTNNVSGNLGPVACSADGVCDVDALVLGGLSEQYRTTDGGSTWSTIPDGGGTTIQCDGSFCDSSGGGGYGFASSVDGGATWTVDGPVGLAAACGTPSACLVSDGNLIYTTVGATTTTTVALEPSPPTAVVTGSVTYSAKVSSSSSTPTGTVTFTTGALALCSAALSAGTASCASSSAPIGLDAVTATYAGTTAFAASSGGSSVSITRMPTSVKLVRLDPAAIGMKTQVVAAITPATTIGAPTGSVTMLERRTGSSTLTKVCAAPVTVGSDDVGCDTALPYARGTIVFDYSGDSTYLAGTGSAPVTLGGLGCSSISRAGKELKVSKCAPRNSAATSFSMAVSALSSGGKLTFHPSGESATMTSKLTYDGFLSCPSGTTPFSLSGMIVKSAAKAAPKGDPVYAELCKAPSGSYQLVKSSFFIV